MIGDMTPQLVVTDMDGTLLDAQHRIPDDFWPLLEEVQARGIHFAPASGRQLATLQSQFQGHDLPIIAENGTVVYQGGKVINLITIAPETAKAIVAYAASRTDLNWGLVLCRADGAFVSRSDEAFLAECRIYYHRLTVVTPQELIDAANDEVVKLAIYCFDTAEETAQRAELEKVAGGTPVVISGRHWIDIMAPEANKGAALRILAEALGVDISDTIAFGDYLNDYELVKAAGVGYAMENAHPEVKEVADHIAPSNEEHGVLTVLRSLIIP